MFFRESCSFQCVHRTRCTAAGGIQFVGGNRHHCAFFDIPATFLHLFIQFLALTFANFSRRHHHQRNGIHWLTFGVNKLVIHCNDFHIVATRFRDDGRAEFRVRSTNNETFCATGCQAVDRVQCFFAIRHGNLNNLKP
ncbi:Uncharacterised protein [Shigella flexneri]|nr:Uncharacterised protein [Shigella flexneri]